MSVGPSIVWFRDDLRVADHPALVAAVERGAPVVCVYVLDEESPGIRRVLKTVSLASQHQHQSRLFNEQRERRFPWWG